MKYNTLSRKMLADMLRMTRSFNVKIRRPFKGAFVWSIGSTHYEATSGPRKPIWPSAVVGWTA